MDYPMFCYQCEQIADGKGCTKMGVCGKTPEDNTKDFTPISTATDDLKTCLQQCL